MQFFVPILQVPAISRQLLNWKKIQQKIPVLYAKVMKL